MGLALALATLALHKRAPARTTLALHKLTSATSINGADARNCSASAGSVTALGSFA